MCLALFAGLLSTGCGGVPEGTTVDETPSVQSESAELRGQRPRVRKDVRKLTRAERRAYVQAVLKLKQVPSPYDSSLNYYDQFVAWHRSLYPCDPNMPHAMAMPHAGPLFLPWHREYLLLFENALREVSGNPDITVPYWDWTDPESTASVFQDDFMGGDGNPQEGYAVTSGPFRKGAWTVNIQPQAFAEQLSVWPYLVRRFGSLPTAPDLPTRADVRAALATPLYDVPPYDSTSNARFSFRNNLEGYRDQPGQPSMVCQPDGFMVPLPFNPPAMHNRVHGWVGGLLAQAPDGRVVFGTMVQSTSPNDPVFFLHHSNVDRLWTEWQRRHGTDTYAPVSGSPGNNVDDMLMPYHEAGIMVTPRDLQSSAALGYRYE